MKKVILALIITFLSQSSNSSYLRGLQSTCNATNNETFIEYQEKDCKSCGGLYQSDEDDNGDTYSICACISGIIKKGICQPKCDFTEQNVSKQSPTDCQKCGLVYTVNPDTNGVPGTCGCPTKTEDIKKITIPNICTLCNQKYNEEKNTCGGDSVKISAFIFLILFIWV